jgi:hypothetical protein
MTMLLFALIATSSRAQEFSADVVYFDANHNPQSDPSASASHPAAKLYVSGDKIRLETNGITGIVLLTDRHEHTALALRPGRKTFELLASGPSQYFRVENPDDACKTWQSIADQKIICEKAGTETVNGRETIKYRNNHGLETAITAVWIDKSLKFVIKWQSAGVGAELRNIKEEKLAADLFEVPSSYKLASPQKGNSKGFSHK